MAIYQWSTTASSNDSAADDVNWPEGQLPSTVNNSARELMADVAEWLLDVACSVTTSGTSSALTLTTNGGIDSNRDGLLLGFIAHTDASASATLNVDGRGPKSLRKYDDSAIGDDDIVQNGAYLVIYDASADSSSGGWIVLNPSSVRANSVGATQLAATSVSAGSYGSNYQVATFTVDAQGRLTSASNSEIVTRGASLGNVSGNQAINLNDGESFTATVAGNVTFSFSNANTRDEFILYLTNGGSATVTWPTSVDWPDGTAPALTSSGLDVLAFTTADGGTTWHGWVVSEDSK